MRPAATLAYLAAPGIVQCSIADAELKYIPIIVLTGLARQGDEARCLEAGANDYLSKPVSLKKTHGHDRGVVEGEYAAPAMTANGRRCNHVLAA